MKCGYTTWFKVKVQKNAVATSSLQVLNKTTGKLVAKKKGTAKITVISGKKKAVCKVKVK